MTMFAQSATLFAANYSDEKFAIVWPSFNTMLVALLVGIGVGIGLAATLLTYRQYRVNETATEEQRRDTLERFRIWVNFLKYFLVSFALVLITTLLGNTLKERELALKQVKAENDNLGKFLEKALVENFHQQIAFASYFKYLSSDPEARKRWSDYADFIDEQNRKYAAVQTKQDETVTDLRNPDLSEAKRAELEAKLRELQSELDVSNAILKKRGSFTPQCTLPFGGVRNPAIDDQCNIDGGSPDPAKQAESRVKNNFCAAIKAPREITLQDLIDLQRQSANIPKNISDRSVVREKGEGDYVSYVAFVKDAHYSDVAYGENVNCNIPGIATNDIRIVLMADPQDKDECNSITAEMSPHYRPPEWTPENLNAHKDHPVRIRGQLFFDGSHVPCSGTARPNPKRASVWEIHPVYSVEVCSQATISECVSAAAKWTALARLASSGQE